MNAIAKARVGANLTQLQVAREIGVVREAVSKWESGQSLPRSADLPRLAALYHCSIEELLEKPSAPPATETA